MPVLMKGQKWRDAVAKKKRPFSYPLIAEDKIDGIRLDVRHKVHGLEVLSYAEKPLYNLDQWLEPLYAAMARHNLSKVDCEVQVNGNFDDTYRYCRSKKGVPADLKDAEIVVYVLDLPDLADQQFVLRLDNVVDMLHSLPLNFKSVPHVEVNSDEEADAAYADARARGVEGIMYKSPEGLYYEGGRTWDWMKRKPEETHDGKITEILQAHSIHKEPLDRAGSVRVVLEDGTTADPSGIPHRLGADMFLHPEKYIGQWCEFTCMERDRAGGYRHPIFKRMREAKQ